MGFKTPAIYKSLYLHDYSKYYNMRRANFIVRVSYNAFILFFRRQIDCSEFRGRHT
jgi:hypothetical protein